MLVLIQPQSFLNPRVGHPAKEGLRPVPFMGVTREIVPRVGHPAKEGLRLFSASYVVTD